MSGKQTYSVTLDGTERTLIVRRAGEAPGGGIRYGLVIDDAPEVMVDTVRPESDVLSLMHAGRVWEAGLVGTDDGFEVELVGIRHDTSVVDPRRKALRMAEGAGDKSLKTQMPGRVVRLLVAEGDEVTEGQPLIVVEAMKMENEMKSPCDGTVLRLCVEEGEQVQARSVLIELG
jgi:acetyl/propionyl-CoA carboxylase alpha subunit